jgi:hypothetical protein
MFCYGVESLRWIAGNKMRRQMEHEIGWKGSCGEVIGRGRGPDHSKGAKCRSAKGRRNKEIGRGATVLVKQ